MLSRMLSRKIARSIALVGMTVLGWMLVYANSATRAQDPPSTSPSTTQPSRTGKKQRVLAEFRPPGASSAGPGAISGGSRGPDDPPNPIPLAPSNNTGLTATDRPTIMFYLAKPAKGPAIVTMFDTGPKKTKLLEITFPDGYPTAGVQRVDLSKFDNPPLQPDVVYQWNVTIPAKPGEPPSANDGFCGAHIKYDTSRKSIRDQLNSAPPDERAYAFAEAGLWYDALAALMEAIDQDPSDSTLVEQRDLWLRSQKVSLDDKP